MEIHSEEFVREFEKSELPANDGLRNDENESKIESTIHNETRNLSYVAPGNGAEHCTNDLVDGTDNTATFKKPVSVGSKRIRSECKASKISDASCASCSSVNKDQCPDSSQHVPLSYVEPSWGGKPTVDYKMEILKSGVIIETISLVEHSFYVVGRLPSCHLSLAHPTISRYHAILQYRAKASEEDEGHSKGFYIYDLGSTHGTYWNGNRIKPKIYVRLRGGHMLGFGCSQRKYILQAPQEDQEEESPYSVTQLKEMRASELEKRIQKARTGEYRPVEEEESEGIDWGMGEDADEETDLQENPYACITDEDLVLEDPKKTLRGWFEREGYDLRYQTEEKGLGQFLCWVDLPMEDVIGHSLRAEALVKGKKKEAVVQCALEACKILDKHGLLRQANHEARKRKTRNWEAEDYYDSDEDNFLDRTGSIEKKRTQRMKLAGRLEEKAETYDSLLEKHELVAKRISELSNSLENWQRKLTNSENESTEEDALDAFMSNLSSSSSLLSKDDVAKIKLELQTLRKEEASLIKLLNLTRPANLPPLPLSAHEKDETETSEAKSTVVVAQGASSEKNGSQSSLFHRRNIMHKKETNRDADRSSETKVVASSAVSDEITKAESMEEVDNSDDDDQSTSTDSSHASSSKARSDAAASVAPKSSSNSERMEEIGRRQEHSVRITKKPRRKEQEIHCDQDAYADNYSTWVPPEDQAGDGKTSLNEKYGY
ncbi:kanadaptin [Ceratina calcarata]|uniref:Kanadaptin n=1 Tax=Ceratina calcarata TaxID=156304 RepID=A0AAJ7J4D3_9HYME|nr:kanadaptin [Ceratina calcarata]